MRLHLGPFRGGRWLARLLHQCSVADDDMPEPKSLIYRTRSVDSIPIREHRAQSPMGSIPRLHVELHRLDASCWWGPPMRLWRVGTTVTLLAGPHPVTLTAGHSFAHESVALNWFSEVADVWSQVTEPPVEGWTNPAPWRPNPVPVGTATAFWYPAPDRPDALSDLFWLTAFGVDLDIRLRTDGVHVHVDPARLDPAHGPLMVEVAGAGVSTYGTDHRDHG